MNPFKSIMSMLILVLLMAHTHAEPGEKQMHLT